VPNRSKYLLSIVACGALTCCRSNEASNLTGDLTRRSPGNRVGIAALQGPWLVIRYFDGGVERIVHPTYRPAGLFRTIRGVKIAIVRDGSLLVRESVIDGGQMIYGGIWVQAFDLDESGKCLIFLGGRSRREESSLLVMNAGDVEPR